MRGADERQGSLFSYVDMESRIPADHPLRRVLMLTDRAQLIQLLYSVRSERLLVETAYTLTFSAAC